MEEFKKDTSKIMIKMNTQISFAYCSRLDLFIKSAQLSEKENAWKYLSEAHILSHLFAKEHTYVHFLMMKYAVNNFDIREFLAQIPRVIFAFPASFLKLVPLGNTGLSRTRFFRESVISEELMKILKSQVNEYR